MSAPSAMPEIRVVVPYQRASVLTMSGSPASMFRRCVSLRLKTLCPVKAAFGYWCLLVVMAPLTLSSVFPVAGC